MNDNKKSLDNSINLIFELLRLDSVDLIVYIIGVIGILFSLIFMYITLPQISDTFAFFSLQNGYISHAVFCGRWFRALWFSLLNILGYHNVIPFYSFAITALLMPYSAVLILKSFNIKSILLKSCFAIIFVTLPPLLELYITYFEVFDNAIALLFVAICIYLLIHNNRIVIPTILLCFATAIYQVYFCFTVSILIIYLISLIYKNEISNKDFFNRVIRYICVILFSLAFYYIINVFALKLFNINSRFSNGLDFKNIFKHLIKMYGMVLVLPFKSYAGLNTTLLTKILFFTIYLYLLIKNILFIFKTNNKMKYWIIPLFIALPIAFNTTVLSGDRTAIRTCFPMGLIFLLLIIYIDNSLIVNTSFYNYTNLVLKLILILFSMHYLYYANGFSYHAYLVNETSKSYAVELVSRIKNLEYYNTDRKVSFIFGNNMLNYEGYYTYCDYSTFPIDMPIITFDFKDRFEDGIRQFGGFGFKSPSPSEVEDIKLLDTYKNMPIYPNAGSIQLLNDIIVVKLSE